MNSASVSFRKTCVVKALLLCGFISSILYIATDLIAALQWPGYSINSQTVSELFAVNAPTRYIVVPAFIIYAFLIYAFGTGMWIVAGPTRFLRIASILIISKEVLGLTGTLFFPIHLRGVEGNYMDVMHGIITGAGVFLCMFPAIGFAATSFGKFFRLYSMATIVVFIIFGILAGLYGASMAANLPTPCMGIYERINIYGYMLWMMVLSGLLLKKHNMNQQ
ncbi:MAG: DUF998 domain-containing protein [Sphingobacteriales bacterium]|nr:MAG: DUF998 domain-containing protein [Sphingobacteriales bacterium]